MIVQFLNEVSDWVWMLMFLGGLFIPPIGLFVVKSSHFFASLNGKEPSSLGWKIMLAGYLMLLASFLMR